MQLHITTLINWKIDILFHELESNCLSTGKLNFLNAQKQALAEVLIYLGKVSFMEI